jgi:hypothetical protein
MRRPLPSECQSSQLGSRDYASRLGEAAELSGVCSFNGAKDDPSTHAGSGFVLREKEPVADTLAAMVRVNGQVEAKDAASRHSI